MVIWQVLFAEQRFTNHISINPPYDSRPYPQRTKKYNDQHPRCIIQTSPRPRFYRVIRLPRHLALPLYDEAVKLGNIKYQG
jgi:hypothetical protein